MDEERNDEATYHRRRPSADAAAPSAEAQGVIMRAELAAQGHEAAPPQPIPDDVKKTALKHDDAEEGED
ncbi:hypothetical protein [Streptomyces sp. NPDC001194]|uniref:hypothetical protein n=1 Tax=Streptomyces sp. NPDC001194 TaxID=3364547 RepID=UPI0036B90B35